MTTPREAGRVKEHDKGVRKTTEGKVVEKVEEIIFVFSTSIHHKPTMANYWSVSVLAM